MIISLEMFLVDSHLEIFQEMWYLKNDIKAIPNLVTKTLVPVTSQIEQIMKSWECVVIMYVINNVTADDVKMLCIKTVFKSFLIVS